MTRVRESISDSDAAPDVDLANISRAVCLQCSRINSDDDIAHVTWLLRDASAVSFSNKTAINALKRAADKKRKEASWGRGTQVEPPSSSSASAFTDATDDLGAVDEGGPVEYLARLSHPFYGPVANLRVLNTAYEPLNPALHTPCPLTIFRRTVHLPGHQENVWVVLMRPTLGTAAGRLMMFWRPLLESISNLVRAPVAVTFLPPASELNGLADMFFWCGGDPAVPGRGILSYSSYFEPRLIGGEASKLWFRFVLDGTLPSLLFVYPTNEIVQRLGAVQL
jgi:hypothetical protein